MESYPDYALVLERQDIPQGLENALRALGVDRIERVALLPEGEAIYPRWGFMESYTQFSPSASCEFRCADGRLLVAASLDDISVDPDEANQEIGLAPLVEIDPSRVIRVWRFEDLPQHLVGAASSGGDEDWSALVPERVAEHASLSWLDEGGRFGCCDVRAEDVDEGTLYTGRHA